MSLWGYRLFFTPFLFLVSFDLIAVVRETIKHWHTFDTMGRVGFCEVIVFLLMIESGIVWATYGVWTANKEDT
jgi:NADH:ubiquinone oxidoreductase subunit 3 (subunit A)